jgi:DNA-3-methyladenine glycosylase
LQSAFHLAHEVRWLSRASLPSDTAGLARHLIGKTIVRMTGRNRISGRIVETEAYPPGDPSGHAYHGRTARNQSLFLDTGFAYVYFIYGTSYIYMLNVTAEEPGVGAGVLLRAIRDGSRLHWKSTGAWTELTCVPMARFGLGCGSRDCAH